MPTPYSGIDNFPASYNIPADTDNADATSVNTGLEALGDRTTWLKNRSGEMWLRTLNYTTVDDVSSGVSVFPPTTQWTSGAIPGMNNATAVTGLSVLSATVPSPGLTDVLFFDAAFSVQTNDDSSFAANDAQFEWRFKIGAGSFARVPATCLTVQDDGVGGSGSKTRVKPVTLSGHLVTSGAGVYTLQVYGNSQTALATVRVVGSMNIRLWHYAAP